jgi:hypothetical protein
MLLQHQVQRRRPRPRREYDAVGAAHGSRSAQWAQRTVAAARAAAHAVVTGRQRVRWLQEGGVRAALFAAAFVEVAHSLGVAGDLDVVDREAQVPGDLLNDLRGTYSAAGPFAV